MKQVIITMKSSAPYCQSRQHFTPKLNAKEGPDAYEERTWREKCTTDSDGVCCIPAIAFQKSFQRAAAMLSMQIPGRGKSTYTKHFLAGVIVPAPLSLGVKKEDVQQSAVPCSSDGNPRSGRRVLRYFPTFPSWQGNLEVYIIDDTIPKDVFEKHAHEAGLLVGVGQNRPDNGGSRGRFICTKFVWSDIK
jgi:hypothetical protein